MRVLFCGIRGRVLALLSAVSLRSLLTLPRRGETKKPARVAERRDRTPRERPEETLHGVDCGQDPGDAVFGIFDTDVQIPSADTISRIPQQPAQVGRLFSKT